MIATLITMLVLNPVLTIIPVVTAIIMLLVTSKLAGPLREILCSPAERSGRSGRLYRGNVGWPESGQGILP